MVGQTEEGYAFKGQLRCAAGEGTMAAAQQLIAHQGFKEGLLRPMLHARGGRHGSCKVTYCGITSQQIRWLTDSQMI